MSQSIIYPRSITDAKLVEQSNGYESSVGSKSLLPDESSKSASSSRLYYKSLLFKGQEISLSAISFLFQEMIVYLHRQSTSIQDFETKLTNYGMSIGSKLIELLNFRASVSPTSSFKTITAQNDNRPHNPSVKLERKSDH